MKLIEDKPWFAPKTVGIGAGLPIAWQGWVMLAAFIGGMALAGRYLDGVARALALCVLVALFVGVALLKTEGGWRWRP